MGRIRWHVVVFLAPAVLVYTAVMIFPLFDTLRLALFNTEEKARVFVGLANFRRLFLDRTGPNSSGTRWRTTSGSS